MDPVARLGPVVRVRVGVGVGVGAGAGAGAGAGVRVRVGGGVTVRVRVRATGMSSGCRGSAARLCPVSYEVRHLVRVRA